MEGGDVAMLTDSVALCLLTPCRVFGLRMESLLGTLAYACLLLILSQPYSGIPMSPDSFKEMLGIGSSGTHIYIVDSALNRGNACEYEVRAQG